MPTSVADPDPNADPDPHVFGPPGSGSGSIRKFSKKNLDFYCFVTSFDFLSSASGSESGSISQRHGSADPDPDPH